VFTTNGTYIAKHLRHRIISLRGEAWAHQIIVCLPLYIEMPVRKQAIEQPCIMCVRGIYFAFVSTSFKNTTVLEKFSNPVENS
jgi:hypothetical protein